MITDGSYQCELCGEWLTGCSLCGTAPLVKSREPTTHERYEQERELANQERSIRAAADRRAGWIV